MGGGDYLRRYGNGKFAIHLSTWWKQENLEALHADLAAQEKNEEMAVCLIAIAELNRRVAAIQSRLVSVDAAPR